MSVPQTADRTKSRGDRVFRRTSLHDPTCREIRWVHHVPWRQGAPVISMCLGCTAVRRIDGARIRTVNGGPVLVGAR